MKTIVQQGLIALETAAEALIVAKSDELVAKTIEALKTVIPGHFEDAILDAALPKIQEYVKAEALQLADKIDGQVG